MKYFIKETEKARNHYFFYWTDSYMYLIPTIISMTAADR